jgi:limonene-1,2-epoxide hydrolase
MPDASTDPAEVVRSFCALWGKGDFDAVVDSFTDDANYHNIPMDPVIGREAIRGFIDGFTGQAEAVEFQVRHLVAEGNVVLTERVDVFTMAGGKTIDLPVMGTFEVTDDGKISAWRDYFDLNQFMSQLG